MRHDAYGAKPLNVSELFGTIEGLISARAETTLA